VRNIDGVAQNYPWGDPDSIPSILGQTPDGLPWAEWWLGTHAEGPAQFSDGGPLADESGELPYLLKLLAAAQPLSLQTHPNAQQATAGFNRERREGLAVEDPKRLYRDPHAKPELLCALSSFDALCGFRLVAETVSLLHDLGVTALATMLDTDGLQAVVTSLYRGHIDHRAVVEECRQQQSPAAELVTRLASQYPNDPSVVVTLLLNRVQLERGQALFLGPGNLHAYLSGTGVEVMGASDNVIRGGLTGKVVDVDELLRIVRFEPLADPVLAPIEAASGQWRYPTPDAPFELWRFEVTDTLTHTATTRELLVCTDGDSGVLHQGQAGYLAPGETVSLEGASTVFVVTEQAEI